MAPLGEPRLGPALIDANLSAWLNDALTRVARADSLRRLAATGAPGGRDSPIQVKLEMTRKKDLSEKIGSIPVEWPAILCTLKSWQPITASAWDLDPW